MASSAVKITNELKGPTALGTHHRLVCMTGPNKGKVYYLLGKRVVIGRSENADIQIIDSKISREHAEITFAGGSYVITDLGSPNGVVVNDQKIVQRKLAEGEKIVIGQSVFKYNIIQVSESNNMVVVVKGGQQVVKPKLSAVKAAKEVEEDDNNSSSDSDSEQKKPKIIIMIAVILLVIFVLFDKGDAPLKKNRKSPENAEEVFNINPEEGNKGKKLTLEDADTKKKFVSMIQEGQREAREGNYFRAIEDFNRALQLMPNNGQASYYLSKSKQKLDEEIEKNFIKGKNDYDSKKYQAAISSYCAVEQLIQNYPNDERYKNAVDKISAIEVELGKEKGEIKCFEEKPNN